MKEEQKISLNKNIKTLTEEQAELFQILRNSINQAHMDYPEIFEKTGMERSIVALIFSNFFAKMKKSKYQNFDLSLDYHKYLNKRKTIPDFPKGIYPDFILHKIGNNTENKLVVEFKGWWNNNSDQDIKKLEGLTTSKGRYKYLLGVWVLLGSHEALYQFVINGQESERFISDYTI